MNADAVLFPAESLIEQGQDLEIEVLASYLRRHGWRVLVFNGEGHGLVGRVWYHHLWASSDGNALAARLADLDGVAPIQIAGGLSATRRDQLLLAELPALDAVVRGDPEERLNVLLGCAIRRPLVPAEGLTVRNKMGQPFRCGSAGLGPSLDFPPAADDLFDSRRVQVEQKVLLSRGCHDDCSYCGLQRAQGPDMAERWRPRPANQVADEIEHYYRLGVSRFVFQANVFFGYDERGSDLVDELCRELTDRDLSVAFRFITHPHHLLRNRHLLPRLLQAGLKHVHLGLDSGSPAALERYRVAFTPEEGLAALDLLHRHRVETTPVLIFWDPLARWAEVSEQRAYLRQLIPLLSHRARTAAAILETELLSRHLQAHDGTPLSHRLEAAGVVLEKSSCRPYVLRFADPRVAMFHRLYRWVSKELLAPLRPLTWCPAAVAAHLPLALLPLDLLDRVAERVETGSAGEEAMTDLTDWVTDRLVSDFDTLKDLVTWPRGKPPTLADLLPPV